MPSELPTNIREILAATAGAARGDQRCPPILLKRVCASLKIPVERRPSVPQGKAFLAWDRAKEKTPRILLPVQRHATWDRFCAAHELGHFVLISNYDWIPKGKKQYWETEELCDFFARNLLITVNRDEVRNVKAAQVIELCDEIATSSLIPWKQAAEFISEHSDVCFLVAEIDREGGRVITGSTLPQKQGRSASILGRDLPMPLRNAIRDALRQSTIIEGAVIPTDFIHGKMRTLVIHNFQSEMYFRAEPSGRLVIAGMRKLSPQAT